MLHFRITWRHGEDTIRTEAAGYRLTCAVDSAVAAALIVQGRSADAVAALEAHVATTLVALARSRLRRTGVLDAGAVVGLDRAQAIARERGLALVAAQCAALLAGDAPV